MSQLLRDTRLWEALIFLNKANLLNAFIQWNLEKSITIFIQLHFKRISLLITLNKVSRENTELTWNMGLLASKVLPINRFASYIVRSGLCSCCWTAKVPTKIVPFGLNIYLQNRKLYKLTAKQQQKESNVFLESPAKFQRHLNNTLTSESVRR